MNSKIKSIFKRIYDSRILRLLFIIAGALLFIIFFLFPAIVKSWSYLSTELEISYCVDDPLYWAVGRGILNGLKPYVDLFENKPPGIFWLSALSLKLTGGVYAMNIFSFLCLLITALTPAIGATVLCWKRACGKGVTILAILSSLFFGAMLMVFSKTLSGYIQIEAMGAMFVGLYLILIFDADASKLKFYSPRVLLSGLLLACAGLLKEPFVLVAAGSSLLFIGTLRGFFHKTVLPLLYGGAIGTAAMAATGVLKPYLTIYLKYMISSRVESTSSPLIRMWDLSHLFNETANVSVPFLCVLTLLFITILFYYLQDVYALPSAGLKSRLCWGGRFLALFAGLMAASFALAVGGRYFYHHFVFALPFYLTLFLVMLRGSAVKPVVLQPKKEDGNSPIGFGPKACRTILAVVLVILSVSFRFMPSYQFDETIRQDFETMETHAEYVDSLLDEMGIDRYLFLGFNNSGSCFYGLTEHSPLGPVFVQDPANFTGQYTWFNDNFLEELDEAQIVFVWSINVGDLTDDVWAILNTEFVRDDAHSVNMDNNPVPGLPDGFTYITYIRNATWEALVTNAQ